MTPKNVSTKKFLFRPTDLILAIEYFLVIKKFKDGLAVLLNRKPVVPQQASTGFSLREKGFKFKKQRLERQQKSV